MELLHIPFEVIVSDIDEQIDYTNDLVKEIEKLSFRKAQAVFKDHSDALVIGSDTIVKIGNDVLGKPKNIEDAKAMLKELSDNTHQVVTGVTILYKDKAETFSSVADVTFYPLSDEEIDAYIATNEPMDKAGSYAIQGDAAKFIRSIHGDYYTIVGLPIAELYHRLKKYL
ncbi:MAG: septum formation protein Maf [Erysipelotrichaceae bacterium]|nr:septum formation protein Maf [Erysipelotrichaceae bacterium]MBR3005761.1 septum formation protein Maf [Erysipelotrichaceae bacterium]